MTISISDFIPTYPHFENNPNFIKELSSLKEFDILRLSEDAADDIPLVDDDTTASEALYLKDQLFFRRYLAQETPYKECLVYKGVGTGKTITAAAVVENYEYNQIDKSRFRPALVLVKGEGMANNVRSEIAERISKYNVTSQIGLTSRAAKGRRKKNIQKSYTIKTWEKFFKNNTPETLAQTYAGCIVIIDESHHFIENVIDDDDTAADDIKSLYDKLHAFLHASQMDNSIKILLTGTPMRNNASDIAYQMNLILPMDQQLPLGDTFRSKYFDNSGKLVNSDELAKVFNGRVSYLRAPWVAKEYVGKIIPGYTSTLKLVSSVMSKEQYALVKGVAETGFDIQSSRMGTVSKVLVGLDVLKNYQLYSCKFKALIDYLEDPKTQDENVFIYSDHVNDTKVSPGALHQLVNILLHLGYKSIKSTDIQKHKNKKTFIATHEGLTDVQLTDLIAEFNKPTNNKGDFCRIIIGGPKLSEGYSFKNIRQIHILNPPWHMASLTQSIARGIRYNSLASLDDNERYVRIFLHAALYPSGTKEVSSDLNRYRTIEDKEKYISQINRVLKENAIDCDINYKRNVNSKDKSGTYDCDYMDCNYKCGYGSGKYTPGRSKNIDTSNYNYLYADDDIQDITSRLKEYFSMNFQITYEKLVDLIRSTVGDLDEFLILRAVDKIIVEKEVFRNRYGFNCYLHELGNIYYLSTNYSIANTGLKDFFESVYLEYPIYSKRTGFDETIRELEIEDDGIKLRNDMNTCTSLEGFMQLSYRTRVMLLEDAYINHYGKRSDSDLPLYLQKLIREKIHVKNDIAYHTMLYEEKKEYIEAKYGFNKIAPKGMTRVLLTIDEPTSSNRKWVNLTDIKKEKELIKEDDAPKKGKIGATVDTDIDRITGVMDGDKFKIRIPPKGRGKDCNSYQIDELFKIVKDIGAYFPYEDEEDESIRELITDMDTEDMKEFIVGKKAYTYDELNDGLDEDDIRNIYYFYYITKSKKQNVCNYIRRLLISEE